MYTIKSYSPQQTYELARRIGAKLQGGELIALEGELGVGKTQFVKGLAAGLGALEPVVSPTFTLIHVYQGRLPLAHFDVYRLPSPEALEELGFEEFFYGPGVTAVEWSDLIQAYLPAEYLEVRLRHKYDSEEELRIITLIPHGPSFEALVKEVVKLEEAAKNDCAGD